MGPGLTDPDPAVTARVGRGGRLLSESPTEWGRQLADGEARMATGLMTRQTL